MIDTSITGGSSYRIIMSETSRYTAILVPVGIQVARICHLCQTLIAQGKANSKQKSINKDK